MTNHPNRSRGPYIAKIGGSSWGRNPTQSFATLRECRAWAEGYGDTADWCAVTDAKGREAACYNRDASGRGLRWYKAY